MRTLDRSAVSALAMALAMLLAPGAEAWPGEMGEGEAMQLCFANQAAIAADLARISLKTDTHFTDLRAAYLEAARLGMGAKLPDDPGQGAMSSANYRLDLGGDIVCSRHGSPKVPVSTDFLRQGFELRCRQQRHDLLSGLWKLSAERLAAVRSDPIEFVKYVEAAGLHDPGTGKRTKAGFAYRLESAGQHLEIGCSHHRDLEIADEDDEEFDLEAEEVEGDDDDAAEDSSGSIFGLPPG